MKKDNLLKLVGYLHNGKSHVCKDSGDNWLITNCVLAPYTHGKGTDRKPSMSICHTKGQSYYTCFTCGHGGSLISLVNKLAIFSGKDYSELKNKLLALDATSINGFDETYEVQDHKPEPVDEALYMKVFHSIMQYPEAMSYLKSRGVSLDTALRVDLRYDPEDMRILFPVYDKEHFYGFSGRAIVDMPDKPRILDYANLPKKEVVLGLKFYNKGRPLVLVEGLFAWLHLIEIGAEHLYNPIATLGSKVGKYKTELIASLGETVYLCFDNDKAGREASIKLKAELGTYVPVLEVEYPENKDDVDDFSLEDLVAGINKNRAMHKATIW